MSVGHELTLKPTSGYIRHAYSMRAIKKCEAMTREKIMRREVTFHMYIPNLRNCEIFVPQQQTDAEYNDISREMTITPCNERPKWWRTNGSLMSSRNSPTTPTAESTSYVSNLPLKNTSPEDNPAAAKTAKVLQTFCRAFFILLQKRSRSTLKVAKRLAHPIKPFDAIRPPLTN